MTGQSCALPGCFKLPWQSVRQGDSPALACGNLHHQLLMASRFNPALTPRCALPSCEKEPCLPHPWCSKKHYLSWLTEFTSSLHPDQMCMLPGCTRHVFVDDNALPSRFCGWRHAQKFVMLSARRHCQQGQLPLVEVLSQASSSPASLNEVHSFSIFGRINRSNQPHSNPPTGINRRDVSTSELLPDDNESEHGSLPSLHSVMHAFKQFVHFGIAPKNSRVIEDFYEKHPWEVLTEKHACWIITCPKFTMRKTRQLTTKGYRWWQRGRPVEKSGYSVKYYAYIERKGKGKEHDQQHAGSPYNMHEYTLEGIETHALIRLVKKTPFSRGKLGKEQPRRHLIADEVDNIGCPQDTVTLPPSDDDMLVDLFLKELPPPDDKASGFYYYPSCTDMCGSCPNGSAAYS